jgi:hypothetical protein
MDVLPIIIDKTKRMRETVDATYGATTAAKLALKDLDEACEVGNQALSQYGIEPDGFSRNLREMYQCNPFFIRH